MLSRSFYQQSSLTLARALIGCVLIHEHPNGITIGIIVETEAYHQNDAASHSYKGKTKRNEVMFGEAGHAYIYFTYGMHYCFNVVAGHSDDAEAVLIRALEPVTGINIMQERRGTVDKLNLCSGPAKLVQSMGIVPLQNGQDITHGSLHIAPSATKPNPVILTSPRIGISQAVDKPWRFFMKDSPYVTRHRFNRMGF